MRKHLRIVVIAVLLSLLCHQSAFMASTEWTERSIIIAGDEYFPPFEYVDTNGVYKGFNIDIMHAIAIEMGLDINIVPMRWRDARIALEAGRVDVIEGITETDERRERLLFSEPHLVTSQTIFISKDNDYIKSLKDLEDKVVAVQENDVSIDLLSTVPHIKIVTESNQLHALELLVEGKADAYVGNRETGLYSIQKYEYYDRVKVIGSTMNQKNYCIAVTRENEELLNILNEGLRIIKKNGIYDKIYNKWFGEEFASPQVIFKKYIYMFFVAVCLLLGIVWVNMRMNKKLREEVDKRTEELKNSDLFKEHIINSISDGLITFDTKGVVQSLNKNVLEILQVDPHEAIGHLLDMIDFLKFIDRKLFRKALIEGVSFIREESEITILGHNRVIEYNILPLKDRVGAIQGITITFNDVTVQRKNSEQIKRRDKFESIGRLTANIAHEIRNPLTAIKTYIELIPRKINNKDFQEQLVKDVPQVIGRLNEMITELLEYARPREANKTVFALDRPIIEVLSLVEGEINKNAIHLETELNPDCHVKMDSQQFKQILINLVINSIQAIKNVEQPTLIIKTVKDDAACFIEVTDNGIGISEEDQAVIFEPFFTKKSTGTGLGLSIAQQLAEENDGYMTVDSTVSVGTTMRLYLPQWEEACREESYGKNIDH
ncbi:MAG: transporter substrate-binding domain-containing protein [Clostridia bacterium]|nr:transporter substrate-binding domain-containing protein [Clostridia bacterium]